MPRDYKHEYAKFQSSPEQIKNRAKRNKDRKKAEDKWLVKKWDKKEVDHVWGIKSNVTRVISAIQNRGKKEASRLKWSKRDTKNRWK